MIVADANQTKEEAEEGFYKLWPVNKTDDMQQGLNGLALRL